MHFQQFARYQIVRKLGRSMTDVYLALDPETDRHIVLKIIEQSRDEFTQLVIEAEHRGAQIQKQLHQLDARILEIYDFGEQQGCFFVSMQYFEGKSIAELLQSEGRLDPQRAARYAMEVCSQLGTLHSFQSDINGRKTAVVHGDIKPSNIQIGRNGEPVEAPRREWIDRARQMWLNVRPKLQGDLGGVLATMTGGLLGLLLFIPLAYLYRFYTVSDPLRAAKNYADLNQASIASDWN